MDQWWPGPSTVGAVGARGRLGPSRAVGTAIEPNSRVVGTAIETNSRVDGVAVAGLSRDRGSIRVDTWDRIGKDKWCYVAAAESRDGPIGS